MTSESLSRLDYAAKLSDVSLGQLQVGLGQLSKNMQSGNEAFTALGISVTDAQGNLRGTEEVLLDVAERFGGMEDGAGKTALAMAIFGRSGADLIPMLNAGRDGLAQMTDEAARFGLTISTQTSKAAEGFNDNLTRISSVLTGLGNKIAERSAPAMRDLTDRFIVFVNEGNYVERISIAIGSAMDALAQAVLPMLAIGL
jgi:TP901 family phage tail tape measure protein